MKTYTEEYRRELIMYHLSEAEDFELRPLADALNRKLLDKAAGFHVDNLPNVSGSRDSVIDHRHRTWQNNLDRLTIGLSAVSLSLKDAAHWSAFSGLMGYDFFRVKDVNPERGYIRATARQGCHLRSLVYFLEFATDGLVRDDYATANQIADRYADSWGLCEPCTFPEFGDVTLKHYRNGRIDIRGTEAQILHINNLLSEIAGLHTQIGKWGTMRDAVNLTQEAAA